MLQQSWHMPMQPTTSSARASRRLGRKCKLAAGPSPILCVTNADREDRDRGSLAAPFLTPTAVDAARSQQEEQRELWRVALAG